MTFYRHLTLMAAAAIALPLTAFAQDAEQTSPTPTPSPSPTAAAGILPLPATTPEMPQNWAGQDGTVNEGTRFVAEFLANLTLSRSLSQNFKPKASDPRLKAFIDKQVQANLWPMTAEGLKVALGHERFTLARPGPGRAASRATIAVGKLVPGPESDEIYFMAQREALRRMGISAGFYIQNGENAELRAIAARWAGTVGNDMRELAATR